MLLAEDGVDALLKMGRNPIELTLSDINMPNLDGLKLLEIVDQNGSKAPVVFLSAESDPEVELQGLQMGAADFVRKPIQKEVHLHRGGGCWRAGTTHGRRSRRRRGRGQRPDRRRGG